MAKNSDQIIQSCLLIQTLQRSVNKQIKIASYVLFFKNNSYADMLNFWHSNLQ